MATRDDLLRAATIIDCEGSIYIGFQRTPYKGKNPAYRQRKYENYFVRVSVGMVDDVMVPWLARTFALGTMCRSPHPLGKHDIVRWNVASKHTAAFLRAIYPFLLLKRDQAKVALRFCWIKAHSHRTTYRKGVKGNLFTRPSIQRQFARCQRELRQLYSRAA